MKPSHDFVAQRALAQHCAELIPAEMPQRDLLADGAVLVRDIAAELGKEMASIAQGGELKVGCGAGDKSSTTAFINRMGLGVAHCVIGIGGGPAMMFSVKHQCVHMLTDRAYGGTGEVADGLSPELPLSADLTLRQLEAIWRDAVGRAVPSAHTLQIARRGHDLGRLDPFRGQAQCVQFELMVEQAGQETWAITVSASLGDLERFLAARAQDQANQAGPFVAADPLAQPFGDIVLEARAVLAEMSLSLARISALKVGDHIPLSIAHNVPLLIGNRAIAHGSVGMQNDCTALQINHLSSTF